MSDIVWQDPPPRTRHQNAGRTQLFVEAWKAQPGRWALYPGTFSSASAGGSYKVAFPGTDMYARWIGGAS
jgi:hypothetical protein